MVSCCRMRKGCGYRNARRYRVGASTGRSVVMMTKMPSASRTGTERVIIQISPPPSSKYGSVQARAFQRRLTKLVKPFIVDGNSLNVATLAVALDKS